MDRPGRRRYDEEGSSPEGSRKKRRGYDGSPIQSTNKTNKHCANHRSHEDYTVAVVCAKGFELSAVRYMLDEEHPSLPTMPGDSNSYVLGKLSRHDVVIVCLPHTQGKGAAAIVATNMGRTFPAIKWRLLVGIGGGVPSPAHDIRLGDIVVSMPDGPFGGVVQYDLGKDIEDGFTLGGFLLPPPPRLRSAVEMMRSDHLIKSNKVNVFLSAMLRKLPRHSDYERPSADSDLLFQPDYPHANQGTCRGCERSQIVDRPARGSDTPEIHYGLVASGDRVMRSAMKRNKISRDIGDILCFEMEAAGIMTEFPCIVIRGISDYADTHKSDIWQHYAAATAAACAKELLSYLDPEEDQTPPKLTTIAKKALPERLIQEHLWSGILEPLKSDTLRMPPQMKSPEHVTVIDARNRRIRFFLDTISSVELFTVILEEKFKDLGLEKIKRREWYLQDHHTGKRLDLTKPWESLIWPGQLLDMTMIFRRRNISSTQCPACHSDNLCDPEKQVTW
ncbi:nucleoside phosphorylase domain-containing protein [Aspergillus granulosus]|uniref:Nucleoside phosphorylase domain-containing protein n=1 Tax=Aspergillus granulosus TaxID=176169 RepID=A0ABR4GW87_9EURO